MTHLPCIADIMARKLIVLTPEMDILRAMSLLLEHGISGACVVDDKGALVGVLSKKDCLRAALHAAYHQSPGASVAEFMSRDPETIDGSMDLLAAAERFLGSEYRRFPVTEAGRLVGQVSRADVLRALAENWSAIPGGG
ncbi:CBS domain-containing protein [Frigidibacter sp. ROC022]|uniref:CBS domain-containing protein n=1 Tax=Frigidibacter sp. ROC022 TaxID=2971796 RepID=UPI00215A82E1|nr:CBS domain-containing protein [Frigidibacter sp. ROC022]MCR8725532.1 CBS domain-containing protein [Frigidibacter sp. ROC022]